MSIKEKIRVLEEQVFALQADPGCCIPTPDVSPSSRDFVYMDKLKQLIDRRVSQGWYYRRDLIPGEE